MEHPTVIAQFEQASAAHPRRTAVFWGRDRINYGALRASVETFAANLQQRAAIIAGDRVGILLRNSPEFILSLYAALKSGATVVPVNTFLKAPEIQHIIDDCRLKCLITDESFDEVTGKIQR